MRFSYMNLATVVCLAVLYSSVALSNDSPFIVHLSQWHDLRELPNGNWELSQRESYTANTNIDLISPMTIEPDSSNPSRLIVRSPNFQPGSSVTLTAIVGEQVSDQTSELYNPLPFNLEALSAGLRNPDTPMPRRSMLNLFTTDVIWTLVQMYFLAGDDWESVESRTEALPVVDYLISEADDGTEGDTTNVPPPAGDMTVSREADASDDNGRTVYVYNLNHRESTESTLQSNTNVILEFTRTDALWSQQKRESWVRTYAFWDWMVSRWGQLKGMMPTKESMRGWGNYFFSGSNKKESKDASDQCLITTGYTCSENEYSADQVQLALGILSIISTSVLNSANP